MKISLDIKDFSLPYERLDAWVTEAIKVSNQTKQELNSNNLFLSRSRIKALIENEHLKVDGITVKDPSFKLRNCEHIEFFLPKPSEPIPVSYTHLTLPTNREV